MKIFDRSFSSPYHNVAMDEALLLQAEEQGEGEILRFWETQQYFAVLGHSNKIQRELDVHKCRENKISIIRRTSGGGTILNGPGCLNYTLILNIEKTKALRKLNETYAYVLDRLIVALQAFVTQPLKMSGICDLCMNERKFSGNAQRRKKHYVLCHGTFLYDFDIQKIEDMLPMPSAEPDYRKNRPHQRFLTNLPLSVAIIKDCLCKEWHALEPLQNPPFALCNQLVQEKYSKEDWTNKF